MAETHYDVSCDSLLPSMPTRLFFAKAYCDKGPANLKTNGLVRPG
jgi:hypothetical protein